MRGRGRITVAMVVMVPASPTAMATAIPVTMATVIPVAAAADCACLHVEEKGRRTS